jgi:hypothetical protein
MKNTFRRGLFHPDDIKTLGLSPTSPGPLSAPLPELKKRKSRLSLSPILVASGSPMGPMSAIARSHSRSSSFASSLGRSDSKHVANKAEFGKYAESEDEDYDDLFSGKANGNSKRCLI